jgi:hypothetical protein
MSRLELTLCSGIDDEVDIEDFGETGTYNNLKFRRDAHLIEVKLPLNNQ